eukprot:Nk52_evm66s1073 gene=Nk52_evmTU66s1073
MGALTNGGTVVVDSDRDSLPSSDEESRPNGAEELTRAVNTIAANRNVSSITLRTPVMDATIELGDNLTPRNRLRDVLEVGHLRSCQYHIVVHVEGRVAAEQQPAYDQEFGRGNHYHQRFVFGTND